MYSLLAPIREHLQLLNCPYEVSYNPTRPGLTVGKTGIVFSLDEEGGDQIIPSSVCSPTHKTPMVMTIGCKCRVYAKSNKAAATVWEHQALARQITDQVLSSIRYVISANKTVVAFGKLGFLSQERLKLDGLETWPGVVYEFDFSIARPVTEKKWTGEFTQEIGNVDAVENASTVGE